MGGTCLRRRGTTGRSQPRAKRSVWASAKRPVWPRVSLGTYNKAEQGKGITRPSTLKKIREALGVAAELGGHDYAAAAGTLSSSWVSRLPRSAGDASRGGRALRCRYLHDDFRRAERTAPR